MKSFKIAFFMFFSALSLFSSAQADFYDRVYVSNEEIAESNYGNLFLQVEDAFYSVDQFYPDQGLYFFEARDLGEFPEEYIIRCPCMGCGRLQTSSLVLKNKNRCSSCGQNMYRCKSR